MRGRVGVVNGSSVGVGMVSQSRGSPESIVGRDGTAWVRDSWYERTASATSTEYLSSVAVDCVERLRLDTDEASSERSSITVGRDGIRCGDGDLECGRRWTWERERSRLWSLL